MPALSHQINSIRQSQSQGLPEAVICIVSPEMPTMPTINFLSIAPQPLGPQTPSARLQKGPCFKKALVSSPSCNQTENFPWRWLETESNNQNFRETFKHKITFRRGGFGYGNPKIRYVSDLGPKRACKHSPPLPVNPDSGNRSFPVIVCKWKTAPGPTGTASRPSGLCGWS